VVFRLSIYASKMRNLDFLKIKRDTHCPVGYTV
jgi:hypothetical protein